MSYTVDIKTTGNGSPPDKQSSTGMGTNSSEVWVRVNHGDRTTGWHRAEGCASMHKARAGFNAALATYGDVGEDVGAMFEAVTGVPWPL